MYSVPLTPHRELRQRTAKWGGGVEFFFQLCYFLALHLAPTHPLYCSVAWKWPFSPFWTPFICSFFLMKLLQSPSFWHLTDIKPWTLPGFVPPCEKNFVFRYLNMIYDTNSMTPTSYSDEIWHCDIKLNQEVIFSHIPEDLLDNSLQLYLPLGNLMVVLCNPSSLTHTSAMLEELLLRKRML